MINVGIIGIGFMGVTHFKALREIPNARAAAISTRDAGKLSGDWSAIQGNFGDAGGVQDLSDVARYEDWRDLLKDETIDLVSICLPTHLHRDVSIAALQAGKHVLVEKPLALSLEDADAMIAEGQKANRLLMVGQVLRFFPAFAFACEIVHSGKYGALQAAHFKRIIAAPSWSKDDHFQDILKSGGPALDLHIHDTDFIHYLCGVPQAVRATGVVLPNGAMTYLQSQYIYENGAAISSQSGAIAMSGLGFEHGFDIYLQNATLQFNNLLTGEDIWIYKSDGQKEITRPPFPPAFEGQLQHAVECVISGQPSPIIDASFARQSLAVCLLEQQAALSGQMVEIS